MRVSTVEWRVDYSGSAQHTLALVPTTAMPLLPTPQARDNAQKNMFCEYNIIPFSTSNSPFPIAEPPLSKSASSSANQLTVSRSNKPTQICLGVLPRYHWH